MSEAFLSSDDFDEQAHQLYNQGRYDEALETLKDGLAIYPNAVELRIGMGYAYLAREEFAWSRRAFEQALARDPDHEDALGGMGEALLAVGDRRGALESFERLLQLGFQEDLQVIAGMIVGDRNRVGHGRFLHSCFVISKFTLTQSRANREASNANSLSAATLVMTRQLGGRPARLRSVRAATLCPIVNGEAHSTVTRASTPSNSVESMRCAITHGSCRLGSATP